MGKILVVEDDESLREVLEDYLTSKGHKVVTAANGKIAKSIALTGEFQLVISDVQMPYLNGVELLQWLKTQSKMPFILMTGFTNLLETQKASDLGADGFLSKPFSNQELLQLVESLLAPPAQAPAADQTEIDANYCKVSINEFVARPETEYDIYIKLQPGRYLKVAHFGETLDVARLKSYREKGISHLHIRKEDFAKLVDFNLQVSKVLRENSSVSNDKKMQFARYTTEVILEKCYIADMDREAFDEANEFFIMAFGAATESPDLLSLVELLNGHSDHLYAHCLGVAINSVMIAKRMGFESPQVHFKLSMAGLFHDIGKKEIDREIIDKSRPLLTLLERKTVESHVQRGREIMEAIPGVPSDIIQIIQEHHEDEIEQGYPNCTPRGRLHPLSRIVHVADQFVTRAIRGPANPNGSANVAIEQMLKFDSDRLNTLAFNALKQLIIQKKAA